MNKIFINFLLVGIVNLLIGCSSSEVVTISEINQIEEMDNPVTIQVVSEVGLEYKFSNSNYYIKNDTLYGTGPIINESWIPFEGKFALDEIEEIEFYSFTDDWTYRLTISEYVQFEKDEEKPAAINLTTFDSTKYYLIGNEYFIDGDTLYGKGQSLYSDKKELSDRKIALSDIVSTQYNYTNKINIDVCYDPASDTFLTFEDAGSEVYVKMNTEKEYSGELLSVNDSVMILFDKHYVNEEDIPGSVYSFYSMKNQDIKLIELKEGNSAIYGIIFGGLVGGGIGFAVSQSKDEEKEKSDENSFNFDLNINLDPLTGCCIGGLVGAMIGGIIGFSIPDNEVVYEYAKTDEYAFNQLSIHARYGSNKPYFLRKIK